MSRLVVNRGERELRLDPIVLHALFLLLEVGDGELRQRATLCRFRGGEPDLEGADALLQRAHPQGEITRLDRRCLASALELIPTLLRVRQRGIESPQLLALVPRARGELL